MLTILPEKNPEIAQPILSRHGAQAQEAAVLSARCGEEFLGYIALDLHEFSIQILDLSLTGCDDDLDLAKMDKPLADSLIKAAASYGMNRNCFVAECTNQKLFSLLQSFGFQQIDNKMTIDFARLIGKCKNC